MRKSECDYVIYNSVRICGQILQKAQNSFAGNVHMIPTDTTTRLLYQGEEL